MHYKNGYDLGKPFLVCSILEFVLIAVLETLEHVLLAVLPQSAALLESYALHDQLRQLPILLGGAAVWLLLSTLAFHTSAGRFEKVDL